MCKHHVTGWFCMARLVGIHFLILAVMAFKRFTVFSRKVLLLLLVMPRSDPSSFSTLPGRALILDPGGKEELLNTIQRKVPT